MSIYIFLAVGSIILLGAGCANNDSARSTDNQVQIQSGSQQVNSLDLQVKCASQAEKALKAFEDENTGMPSQHFVQQNHYNQKMSKCFVYITYEGPALNGNTGSYWALKDAFENKDLGACAYNLKSDPPGGYCWIEGGPGALAQEDIDNFIRPRMESLPR